jgi:hypothetical protein
LSGRVQKLTIGRENAPLIVIDDVVPRAESLVDLAATKVFSDVVTYYPGIRAKVPLTYQQTILEQYGVLVSDYFGMPGARLRFTGCHFAIATTPPERLDILQRIPHVDSFINAQLAFIHYLFKADLGGTAFFRHRKTGFEFVDEARASEFMTCRDQENTGPDAPAAAYIDGSTPLYEEISTQQAVFNRMLIYRRTSLHCARLVPGYMRDPSPRTGRLSITGFLA